MTDDLVARLPTDAATRRLPEFIKTLRINRAARRESVYASDNVYALLDALDAAEARVRELEAQLAEAQKEAAAAWDKCEERRIQAAEAYERAAKVAASYDDGRLVYDSQGHAVLSRHGEKIATAICKLAQETP